MVELPTSTHTVVIGAGQAGLIMSRHLREAGREHVVLDRRDELGGGWRDRWDAFQLVTPNFLTDLPGFPYDGGDPDGYMSRDEIAGRVAAYASAIDAPVALSTTVQRLTAATSPHGRFRVETSRGVIHAQDVIVASGAFHVPRVPSDAGFGPAIHQLHAHHYRNEAALPPGGVLVIGSGQTGVQLAEELHAAGRAGDALGRSLRAGTAPLSRPGLLLVDAPGRSQGSRDRRRRCRRSTALPDPRARFACNPHLSGHGGGHDTDLRRFAADGIRLVGRFEGADGDLARFAADLGANLSFADEFFDQRFKPLFEAFAERAGVDAPPDDRVPFALEVPERTSLDLAAEGISTVLWTTGYAPDYGWLDLPVVGEFGLPRHVRGISEVPGLSFIGLLWQHNQASANFGGVAADAAYLRSQWNN